jgi:succinyl-CoA synthetase alpha subunit
MGILVDEQTTVVVQGITGREGSARAGYMKDYGTSVVAGVTPGRGGGTVDGVPVYDSVAEAVAIHGPIDCAVAFVPGPAVLGAALEAIDAGVRLILPCVERVPLHDLMRLARVAEERRVRIVGPGSNGVLNPERAVIGWLGGSAAAAREVFRPGPVGIISRSGGQSGTLPYVILQAGLGASTVVHIGTETITCTSMADVLRMFEDDPETRAVAAFGEVGGSHEEEAAAAIEAGEFTKPFVIFVAGAWAPEGMQFSHASSLVERGRGGAREKITRLREAGAWVVDRPDELAAAVAEAIGPAAGSHP